MLVGWWAICRRGGNIAKVFDPTYQPPLPPPPQTPLPPCKKILLLLLVYGPKKANRQSPESHLRATEQRAQSLNEQTRDLHMAVAASAFKRWSKCLVKLQSSWLLSCKTWIQLGSDEEPTAQASLYSLTKTERRPPVRFNVNSAQIASKFALWRRWRFSQVEAHGVLSASRGTWPFPLKYSIFTTFCCLPAVRVGRRAGQVATLVSSAAGVHRGAGTLWGASRVVGFSRIHGERVGAVCSQYSQRRWTIFWTLYLDLCDRWDYRVHDQNFSKRRCVLNPGVSTPIFQIVFCIPSAASFR